MKIISVAFSELHNCWLPARVLDNCLGCNRYQTCTYPERVYHIEYERNRRERKILVDRVAELDIAAKKLEGG